MIDQRKAFCRTCRALTLHNRIRWEGLWRFQVLWLLGGCWLCWPVVVPVAEYRDIIGSALTATLSGADPATELKKAHEQYRPILERSEKA